MIIRSFKVCGISKDDTSDSEIHCMKPHGQCPNARDLLRAALREERVEELSSVLEAIDLGQDLENGYISDSSIV